MKTAERQPRQTGLSMIEVLVTVAVMAFGILGLIALQGRLQISEMESYQRSQALILLNDMANRLATNRNDAKNYVTGATAPLGTNAEVCSEAGAASRRTRDICEWSNLLLGAAEQAGTNKVGAFIGGRGCIENLGNDEYLITVAWQGLGPLSAPPSSVACGKGMYDGGTACADDRCRRALTTVVRFGAL